LEKFGETHLHSQGDHFEHGQGDGLAAAFDVADEAAIDAEIGRHLELSEIALAAQFPQTRTETAADVDGEMEARWAAGRSRVRAGRSGSGGGLRWGGR